MSVAAVTTSSGIPLAAEADQTQLATADLVVILGRKDATLTRALQDDLRFASAIGTRIVATGSAVWLLAKAGLLQGRRFSLPDADRQAFGLCFPTLCPAPDAFTCDGTLTTCPDGQIVTDVILHLLHDLLGPKQLRFVLTQCMLAPPRLASDLPRRPPHVPPSLQRALKLLETQFSIPNVLCLAETQTCLTRPQLERLFRAHLQTSPARHLQNLRLAEGRRLLLETNRSVEDIAVAVGFVQPVNFRKRYRSRYGQSPHKVALLA